MIRTIIARCGEASWSDNLLCHLTFEKCVAVFPYIKRKQKQPTHFMDFFSFQMDFPFFLSYIALHSFGHWHWHMCLLLKASCFECQTFSFRILLNQCGRSVQRQNTAFTPGNVWSNVRPELAPGLQRRRTVPRSCLTSYMLETTV